MAKGSDMDTKKKDVLYVRMLDGFSVMYNGVELVDQRQLRSQFCRLMELVLFFHGTGVKREVLRDVLFEEREIDDVQHAIRNIVYNAKKRLKSLGLPDVNYIEVKRGVYSWTEEIPVVLDTEEFMKAREAASAAEGLQEKRELLRKAVGLYRGDFLGHLNVTVWAVQQSRLFREAFQGCVEDLAAVLREQKDFKAMKKLGDVAVKADPFAEWERLSVEALSSLGRYEEAQQLCDDTVAEYIREFGRDSNAYIRELVNRLTGALVHQHESVEEIQSKLIEEDVDKRGGYYCSYPAFQEVYRVLARTMDRNEDMIYLMLCTVVDSKGNPMKEGPKLSDLSVRLSDAVVRSVRHSDTVTKYGMGQYLVLLVNTTEANCRIVQDRISKNFHQGRQRIGIEYAVKSVILTAQ